MSQALGMQLTAVVTVPAREQEAEEIACALGVPLYHEHEAAVCKTRHAPNDMVLVLTHEVIGVSLWKDNFRDVFYVDFASPSFQYRLERATCRNEAIAKAVGLTASKPCQVLDATAGLGRDACLLAHLGARVTMIERHPLVLQLLQDGLKRYSNHALQGRLRLVRGDAWVLLRDSDFISEMKPDVIYLDPMFPLKKKSAAVKKEMVWLQRIVLDDQDIHALWQAALACSCARVVVKRPIHASTVSDLRPTFSVTGRANRFDVYCKGG